MDNRQYRLNSKNSQNSVNEDTFDKIKLDSKTNLLPTNDISKVINLGEQFNLERQTSPYYRITGSFNTLFTNVLTNIYGSNSLTSFNLGLFRDKTFPASATVSLNDAEDYTFKEAFNAYLSENNGWLGFKDPDPSKESLCTWIDMEPNRSLFSLSPKNSKKNWELTITYPVSVSGAWGESKSGDITYGGLLIVDSFNTIIGNRSMVTLATPVKHGLSQGDGVNLTGIDLQDEYSGDYTVVRLGRDNGDDKDYYFSVDISNDIILTSNPRMSRIYNGRKSQYYFRKFKKINVKGGIEMEDDDYEIFPLAFSQNIYEDKINHFVINEDIDISGLKDNLGRPLSEIYLTIVKTSSDGVFTNIKSGVEMPNIAAMSGATTIPHIRRITNDIQNTHNALDSDVVIDQDTFYGDVAEYNIFEQKENILGEVYHRFNTKNREVSGKWISDPGNSEPNISLGVRYEGYMYKPHHKIKIREYSNYIEEGTDTTQDKPSYAIPIGDGRWLWRDLLDIGANDIQKSRLDYPFLNGCHYLNVTTHLPLKRQDPFGDYGLQYKTFPADRTGFIIDDSIEIKKSQDVC